ncbi:STAS domain-containing protein [Streptomyces sp. NPDC048603]|uniref:STAS domain-containing protein n=1 Tax=Streptomyces sp. NPDC048603 TaxID=3365577 RepID=UPI0037229205
MTSTPGSASSPEPPAPPGQPHPAARDGQRFGLEVRQQDGVVILVLSGELDHDTAHPLHEALAAALERPGPPRLVVDCGGLRFCDSTGLNMLLRARLEAQEIGGTVELAAPTRPVARMLEITGADEVFTIHPDMATALRENADRPTGGIRGRP